MIPYVEIEKEWDVASQTWLVRVVVINTTRQAPPPAPTLDLHDAAEAIEPYEAWALGACGLSRTQ